MAVHYLKIKEEYYRDVPTSFTSTATTEGSTRSTTSHLDSTHCSNTQGNGKRLIRRINNMKERTSHVIVFDDDQRKQVELDGEVWETLLNVFKTGECDHETNGDKHIFKVYGKEIARFEKWY